MMLWVPRSSSGRPSMPGALHCSGDERASSSEPWTQPKAGSTFSAGQLSWEDGHGLTRGAAVPGGAFSCALPGTWLGAPMASSGNHPGGRHGPEFCGKARRCLGSPWTKTSVSQRVFCIFFFMFLFDSKTVRLDLLWQFSSSQMDVGTLGGGHCGSLDLGFGLRPLRVFSKKKD